MAFGHLFKGIWPVILAASSLAACQGHAWNQKITVTVDTPDGPKSAFSVINITLENHDAWYETPESRGVFTSMRGEAVVLEVAPKKYLFALLKGMPGADQLCFPRQAPIEVAPRLTSNLSPIVLTTEQYPLLVTFGDIADPASVKRVDPASFEANFGSGYALQSITIAVTDEVVTEGKVEGVLGWLKENGRARSTLIPSPPRLQKDARDPDLQYLSVDAFSTELYK